MQAQKLKFTYRHYCQLPEGDRRELIEGDFYVVPAPNVRHQIISRNLGARLWEFVRKNGLGLILWVPTDVLLSQESVVQPDILFVSNERRGIITEPNIAGAPDLVVEVLSPGTADRDREMKLSLYARHGVREYWIVDPDAEAVQVMELGPEGAAGVRMHTSGSVRSDLLPGLNVTFDEIFASD